MSAPAGVDVRPLTRLEEFDQCLALQRSVWGFAEVDLLPRRMFVVAAAIGGQVLGALAGPELAGYALALPGMRGGHPYLHSHMLAVAPGYRNAGVGRRLKLRQREWALEQGFDRIEWTFDPLEIKNGFFNLERLGASARRYLADLYGRTSSALQAGLPTDRLLAEWRLRAPEVEARARGEAAAPPAGARRVAVPAAIAVWKRAGDERAAAEQRRIREELRTAFAAGWEACGYEINAAGDGALLLRRSAP